jgi:hypothetical protein
MKQNIESYQRKLVVIKEEKLGGLKNLGINPKYTSDLEKFKIK